MTKVLSDVASMGAIEQRAAVLPSSSQPVGHRTQTHPWSPGAANKQLEGETHASD